MITFFHDIQSKRIFIDKERCNGTENKYRRAYTSMSLLEK